MTKKSIKKIIIVEHILQKVKVFNKEGKDDEVAFDIQTTVLRW